MVSLCDTIDYNSLWAYCIYSLAESAQRSQCTGSVPSHNEANDALRWTRHPIYLFILPLKISSSHQYLLFCLWNCHSHRQHSRHSEHSQHYVTHSSQPGTSLWEMASKSGLMKPHQESSWLRVMSLKYLVKIYLSNQSAGRSPGQITEYNIYTYEHYLGGISPVHKQQSSLHGDFLVQLLLKWTHVIYPLPETSSPSSIYMCWGCRDHCLIRNCNAFFFLLSHSGRNKKMGSTLRL